MKPPRISFVRPVGRLSC
ncbi:hypothetical protein ID866_1365 [Astraeus odoratus]|nr:hypothetical protein ID866_1365 [Astraeus odoratus]